ncbi:putative phytosulfokines 6 [Humulus lupulus]|uniref:putative phytosulfokines 6 n=1 Tax=Humulus lupulus TaxID=3486 RepID=UPI002B40AC19|nr:putative phytosulfokines 6 [Humulus lupulus]
MMKQSHLTVFLIFSLLIFLFCFHSDARFLAGEVQGSTVDKKVNYDEEIVNEESFITATKDDILDLMGSKVCDYKDEECLKRRMIAEAHLDYIYTQQHKP